MEGEIWEFPRKLSTRLNTVIVVHEPSNDIQRAYELSQIVWVSKAAIYSRPINPFLI